MSLEKYSCLNPEAALEQLRLSSIFFVKGIMRLARCIPSYELLVRGNDKPNHTCLSAMELAA